MNGFDLPVLAIASIPIVVGVVAGVQAGKVFGVINNGNAGKAAMVIAFALGIFAGVGIQFPDLAPYIDLIFTVYLGAIGAGLGYEYAVKPILSRLGWRVRSSDFE